MKKITCLLLVVICVFFACKKDDDEEQCPKIKFKNSCCGDTLQLYIPAFIKEEGGSMIEVKPPIKYILEPGKSVSFDTEEWITPLKDINVEVSRYYEQHPDYSCTDYDNWELIYYIEGLSCGQEITFGSTEYDCACCN